MGSKLKRKYVILKDEDLIVEGVEKEIKIAIHRHHAGKGFRVFPVGENIKTTIVFGPLFEKKDPQKKDLNLDEVHHVVFWRSK